MRNFEHEAFRRRTSPAFTTPTIFYITGTLAGAARFALRARGTKRFTSDLPTTELDISNIDPLIPRALVSHLMATPDHWTHHFGWNFCGRVWYEAGRFHEHVFVLGVLREQFSADSLEALKHKVNCAYGHD